MSPPSGHLNRRRTRPQANACGYNLSPLRGWTLGALRVQGWALGALRGQGLELEVLRDQCWAQGARAVARCHNDRKNCVSKLAAKRRHVVAMDASRWKRPESSPEGATGDTNQLDPE